MSEAEFSDTDITTWREIERAHLSQYLICFKENYLGLVSFLVSFMDYNATQVADSNSFGGRQEWVARELSAKVGLVNYRRNSNIQLVYANDHAMASSAAYRSFSRFRIAGILYKTERV